MLIAKKFIERKTEGEYEFAKFHIMKVEDVTWGEIEEVIVDSPEFEDPEDAYLKGVPIDYNDDIVWLSVNPFICWIDDYIEQNKKEDEEDVYHNIKELKDLRDRLDKYDEYDIYPPNKNDEAKTEQKDN